MATETVPCTHHWLIESANGPRSAGTCCGCGETRLFENVVFADDNSFNRRERRQQAVDVEVTERDVLRTRPAAWG